MSEARCSFCNKSESEVKKLLMGATSSVHICDSCILAGVEYLKDSAISLETATKPMEIKRLLDEYVIGQEQAKKVLSVAVYNHYKRLANTSNVELQKSNILLVGNSGTGKTHLARTLARILKVPFAIGDATALTEAGYVGEDVETVLQTLLINANGDVNAAEKGIVYIDEIDKKARKSGGNPSITRDVSGEGVQQALLKIIEGSVVNVQPVGGRKHPQQQYVRIDTRNILFILGGAFNGLAEVIAARQAKSTLGFLSDKTAINKTERETKLLKELTHKDLVSFGLIPELVGRVPIIVSLDDLNVEDLCKILTEPKDSLVSQYTELFRMDSIELTFNPQALKRVAEKAIKLNTGARGLRSIMENTMMDLMFELPSKSVSSYEVKEEEVQ